MRVQHTHDYPTVLNVICSPTPVLTANLALSNGQRQTTPSPPMPLPLRLAFLPHIQRVVHGDIHGKSARSVGHLRSTESESKGTRIALITMGVRGNRE